MSTLIYVWVCEGVTKYGVARLLSGEMLNELSAELVQHETVQLLAELENNDVIVNTK
jgi:hypothetical protein